MLFFIHEKVPTDTRFLLVCNHQHLSDVGVLISKFKKSKIAFISKQENRNMPVIGKIMHMTSSQTLDREDDRQALRVILKCIQLVKDKEVSMAVFPEGTRSKTGKLLPFRNGAFKIAQKANVPIVVCTINGTGPLFHNLKKLKTTHIDLHLVDVIQPEELKGNLWERKLTNLTDTQPALKTGRSLLPWELEIYELAR